MATTITKDEKFAVRSTQQRQLILEIIKQADGHVDANEIYWQVRQQSSNISLSTIYHNLKYFKELRLVEEHQLGGMRRYYESKSYFNHHHMVCLGCDRVFEFICPSPERIKSKIYREENFKVTGVVDVRLVGYCPECQQRFLDTLNECGKC